MKTVAVQTGAGYKRVPVSNDDNSVWNAIGGLSSSSAIKDAQIQALTERNEFLEDLIAELAVQVYSTPPNV